MPREIEILPPLRTQVSKPGSGIVTVSVPGQNTGGPIGSALNRWHWEYTSRAVDALTKLNNSEVALYNAQSAVAIAKTKRDDALYLLQEAPERRAHERSVRLVQRANEYREAQHMYEMNEQRRREEYTLAEAKVTHAKATLTHARTVLCDAKQQLNAQREHGELNYELAHAKKNLELLDVQLSAGERRALMRGQLRKIEGDNDESDEERFERELEEDIDAVMRKR